MGRLIFTKRASSSTPEVGKVALYAKNDGKLYTKTEDGTESEVGSGGGGGGEPVDYPITIDKGGTGATTAQGALNALTNVAAASAGYVLTKVGGDVAWAAASNGSGSEAGLPNPAGSNANDVVVSNGNAQYTLVDDTTFVSAAGAVMKSSFPAKGSLVAGAGAGTTGFLSAGTNGKVLAANSAAATGLEWVDRPTLSGQMSGGAVPRITGANTMEASGVVITAGNQLTVPANGSLVSDGAVLAKAGLSVVGNITVTGNVDGRDVSNDGAKLDGIKKDNTTATTDPGTSNNTTQGYAAGSRWINTATSPATLFICTAATSNAATWKQVASNTTGITKAELATFGTNLTPTTSAGDIYVGADGATYNDLILGSDTTASLLLGKDRPPGIATPVEANPYGKQFRIKGARGMLVGGYPVAVQAFAPALAQPSDMPSGASPRLRRVIDFGTADVLPFPFGILHLRISGKFKFTSLVNSALNTPSLNWYLSASTGSAIDPNIVLSGSNVLSDTGVVIATGKLYSPVVLNPADGAAQNDECRVEWDLTVDLSRNLKADNVSYAWTSQPRGMVTTYNMNPLQGTLGDSKSYPVDFFDNGTDSQRATLDASYTGFEITHRPRLAFWFMQTGVNNVNLNTNPDTYADNQSTGISSIKLRAVGQFAPRLNRGINASGLYSTQYLLPDGTLGTY